MALIECNKRNELIKVNEFLDPEQRGESIFVVMNCEDVIGYFCFNRVDKEKIDIG
jgi:[ribosomal protein S18]-alanine N-acetyltransferase